MVITLLPGRRRDSEWRSAWLLEEEHNPRMVLDLPACEKPHADPPAGVTITTWEKRPDLAHGIDDVAVEAYVDVPGAEDDEMESFENWLDHDMRSSADRPDATFIAIVGNDVVGYAKFSLTAARPTVAAHDMTGVKRAWRGRGIARALKNARISWAMQSGYETLQTSPRFDTSTHNSDTSSPQDASSCRVRAEL